MGLDWSGSPVPWLLLAVFSAGPVLAYWKNRPNVVLGLLFIAGSFSAVTVPIAGSNLRLEMVAVPVVAVLVIGRDSKKVLELVRTLKLPVALAGIYLLSNLASSLLFAPAPVESIKIAIWLALSVAACFVAATLTWGRRPWVNLGLWIIAGAVIQVTVGLAAVISEAVFATGWGVMSRDVLLGKAIGLSWEANILSINVAMALPFLIWSPPGWKLSPGGRIMLLVFLSVGLGLAYSRGGLVAFLVGAGCSLALSYGSWSKPMLAPHGRRALSAVAHVAVVLLLAIGTMQFLNLAGESIASARGIMVVNNDPAGSPRPTPSPGAVSAYRYIGTGDTIAIRWRNMTVAVAEVRRSPFIGLGTDSYRMRHVEPSCACPAFINNLTVATFYESGALGVLSLAGFVTCVLLSAWRSRAWPCLAAVIAMVVGYQFTDAIRFESNWVLMGVVLGLLGKTKHDSSA